jgi:hypothetical protein
MGSLISIVIILPFAPFSFKLHRSLTLLVLLLFVASTIYNWLAFPFSPEAPLKVFFQQKLELDLSTNASVGHTSHGRVVRAVTTLHGVPEYLDTQVIPHLPSSWGKEIHREFFPRRSGLLTCTWEGDLLPAPGGITGEDSDAVPATRSVDWLVVNATRTSSTSAQISVQGMNTRLCRLYFDSSPIAGYDVQGSSGGLQGREIPEGGTASIRLWSRTWSKKFVVDVRWSSEGMQEGRVACEWAEYESATAGAVGSGGKIPAFEEVLNFLPNWAVVSTMADGLVEAWGTFSV